MDTNPNHRTRTGHASWHGRVPLCSQTGDMQLAACAPGDEPVVACDRLSVTALAFPKRSGNVPAGGRTGGFQTSAPQVRPGRCRTRAPHLGDTMVARSWHRTHSAPRWPALLRS